MNWIICHLELAATRESAWPVAVAVLALNLNKSTVKSSRPLTSLSCSTARVVSSTAGLKPKLTYASKLGLVVR